MAKLTFDAWDTVIRELQARRDTHPQYSAQWVRYQALIQEIQNEWEGE